MRIKSDAERITEILFTILVLVSLVLLLALVTISDSAEAQAGVIDWRTSDEVKILTDEIGRLETELYLCRQGIAQYTDAAGVIVVRDDGDCAAEWFHLGRDLGCGTSWGRFNTTKARIMLEIP